MLKKYNKLSILSVVLLICAPLMLAVGFYGFWAFSYVADMVTRYYKSLGINIFADFLIVVFYAFLLASIITGIVSLFKIRKTKERGDVIAILSVAISALWFFGSLYAGWGLW